uniref:Type II secretory pathway, component ExeA (Predicted ATPase) n=1 Tax=Candidatus Kentrum sp. DK TaxID=2126562 RepID=A0A450TPZ1_9GAMM|nr:MAG: Type II secretory pathway, component ExeA (predicted ATPase) [Candidatus Kentron sp. DK]
MQYLQFFGLTHSPLDKKAPALWDDGALTVLKQRFQWLLESPGIGMLIGEPGVGKTAALRAICQTANPHRYKTIYLPETDFGRLDIYRALAIALGLQPAYRRSTLWRDIKHHLLDMADNKRLQPVWIIDEAQNLPPEFFRDFPAFLNFAFDSRDIITVWLIGHPGLANLINRAPYTALKSRIQASVRLEPAIDRERFGQLIEHAFKQAGCAHNLLSDSAIERLRQASRGIPRIAGNLLKRALQLAADKGINHIPDDILEQAMEELR